MLPLPGSAVAGWKGKCHTRLLCDVRENYFMCVLWKTNVLQHLLCFREFWGEIWFTIISFFGKWKQCGRLWLFFSIKTALLHYNICEHADPLYLWRYAALLVFLSVGVGERWRQRLPQRAEEWRGSPGSRRRGNAAPRPSPWSFPLLFTTKNQSFSHIYVDSQLQRSSWIRFCIIHAIFILFLTISLCTRYL